MKDSGKIGDYAGMALLLPISTLIGYAIGYFLDKWLHTHFLYIVFLILGTASGIIELIRELSKETDEK